jgi:hypothetical protein
VELDSEGYPWDARIHAKTKSKIGNGTWRLVPKVDKALVASVRAEYKPSASSNEQAPPPPPSTEGTEQAPPPPPSTENTTGQMTAQDVIVKISGLVQQGKLQVNQVTSLLNENGIPSLPKLAEFPDKIETINNGIDSQCMLNS